jgi:hypothetical protein
MVMRRHVNMKPEFKLGCAVAFALLAGVMAVGAIAAGVMIYSERRTLEAEPQTIQCRQLIEEGPGANRHVLVFAFRLLADEAVVEFDVDDRSWVPMRTNRRSRARSPDE